MNQEGCANEKDCEFSCVQEKSSHNFCKAALTSNQDRGISWSGICVAVMIATFRS